MWLVTLSIKNLILLHGYLEFRKQLCTVQINFNILTIKIKFTYTKITLQTEGKKVIFTDCTELNFKLITILTIFTFYTVNKLILKKIKLNIECLILILIISCLK